MSVEHINKSDALPAGTPKLDLERYRPLVQGHYENEEVADAFLRALWFICCSFVDLGMDVKSSTENLPFMRELSSAFDQAAPESEDSKKSNEERGSPERPQKDDA